METDVGNLSPPPQVFRTGCRCQFHSCAAPAFSNLLPSTLNFIFLMKCHLLTSGRIIIKRNGNKAILCRQSPSQLAPPSCFERKAPQSFYVLSCWNIPSQYSEARWHREFLSKPLAPVLYRSGDNRQAATPAAAASIQGMDSALRTSKMTQSTL